MTLSFRQFVEERKHKKHKKKANYIDGLWQELGIDRNALPDFIESGPIEIEDEGILYNQAIWQIIKPIEETDVYVRLKFYKSSSPNFERAYQRGEDGKLHPYEGECDGKVHLVSIEKLSDMLSKGWQSALGAGGAPGGM